MTAFTNEFATYMETCNSRARCDAYTQTAFAVVLCSFTWFPPQTEIPGGKHVTFKTPLNSCSSSGALSRVTRDNTHTHLGIPNLRRKAKPLCASIANASVNTQTAYFF